MLKRILGIVCSLFMLAAGLYLFVYHEKGDPSETKPAGANATASHSQGAKLKDQISELASGQDGDLGLALKTIELSQGEGGFELWRLKAEWANMDKEGDIILVDKPKLTYFLREEDSELFVVSDTGDINQKAHLLRFINNVVIRQGTNTAVGELLIYNGTTKTMTFPNGGGFTGEGMDGKASLVVWHMESQIIKGQGEVEVRFENAPLKSGKKDRTSTE